MYRRLQDMAILMFKVKQGTCPIYIANRFKQHDGDHSLRNADFVIPRFNTVTYGEYSINFGPSLWRRLPRSVKAECNLNNFKNRTKKLN